jgi:MarR family transcriptional regulator, organic hydroperoxide resistance regulator
MQGEEPDLATTPESPGSDAPHTWPTGRLLVTAARLAEHRWNAHLAAHGLSHAALVVLHLLESGPRPQRDLAEQCQVEAQTMSRTLERMERTGLVRRAPDPDDRRRRQVTRTDAGARAFAGAADPDFAERLLLDEDPDRETFRRVLVSMVERLRRA